MAGKMLIDHESVLGSKSELALFDLPATQVGVERGFWQEVYPKASLTDEGPYEFELPSAPQFTDFSRNYLYMTLKITKADGTNLDADSSIAFVNQIGSSFFKQVKVWLASKLCYDSGDTYAYSSYLLTELNYGRDVKDTQLQSSLYFRDQGGKFEDATNTGHVARATYCNGSRVVELMTPIRADLFHCDRLWLNYLPVRVELHRNSDKFCLAYYGAEAANTISAKISVQSMMWYVRRVDVLPSIAVDMELRLKRSSAKYPLRRVQVKTLHVDGGRRDTPNTVLFNGQIPRRMVIGCVGRDNYHGSFKKNPFLFDNFGIQSVTVEAGGIRYPRNPWMLNFGTKHYTRAYMALFNALNYGSDDRSNLISYKDFSSGYCLFCFDLSSDNSDADHWELVRMGPTIVQVEFSQAVDADGIKLICLAEFDNLLSLDSNRTPYFDYTA